MTWAFIVEGEALARKTNAVDSFVKASPFHRGHGDRSSLCVVIFLRRVKCRPKRICPQPILHIGDDQFLVLLLMVDPERHQRGQFRRGLGCKHMHHGIVHVGAVGMHLV